MSIVLVTGSCGLIGSETVSFFAKKGFDIVGIDNNTHFISLSQYLKENMDENTFLDHGHYTAAGYELVAKYIGDSLVKLKIIKTK